MTQQTQRERLTQALRRNEPPVDLLRSAFEYDAETGALTWKASSRRGWVGRHAGSVNDAGYVSVRVAGFGLVRAHVVAWSIFYGEAPKGIIDHINGDKADNRISNLRVVSAVENTQNRFGPQSNSRHQVMGVTPVGNKWRAQVKLHGGKQFHVGYFATAADAHAAYVAAKKRLHPIWSGVVVRSGEMRVVRR